MSWLRRLFRRPWWESPSQPWPPRTGLRPVPSSQATLRAVWLAIDRRVAFEMSLPGEDRNIELLEAFAELRVIVVPPMPAPELPAIPGWPS